MHHVTKHLQKKKKIAKENVIALCVLCVRVRGGEREGEGERAAKTALLHQTLGRGEGFAGSDDYNQRERVSAIGFSMSDHPPGDHNARTICAHGISVKAEHLHVAPKNDRPHPPS